MRVSRHSLLRGILFGFPFKDCREPKETEHDVDADQTKKRNVGEQLEKVFPKGRPSKLIVFAPQDPSCENGDE